MGKLDDLLKKAENKAKVTSENNVFEGTRILSSKMGLLKDKMRDLQNNDKLLELMGKYLKGEIIQIYEQTAEPCLCISVMYDFEERKQPYIHFFFERDDMPKKQIVTEKGKDCAEIREIAQKCPDLTPEILETNFYAALEKRIEELN